MNIYDMKAATKSSYHRGFSSGLDDAAEMSGAMVRAKLIKAEGLAARNRKAGNINAAHYYEGRADGLRRA